MAAERTPEYRALEREIRQAERAYDRALRRRRCEGVGQLGARLHELYAKQRRLGGAK